MTIDRVTVLGDGQMGLVCAALLAEQGGSRPGRVTLWGHQAREMRSLAGTRMSERLSGFVLPEAVEVVADDQEALRGAALVVAAAPTQHIRSVWNRVGRYVEPGAGVVNIAKGIETGTLLRPTEVIAEAARAGGAKRLGPIATLSGPTIAAELARCLPATMVAACGDTAFAARVQELFTTSWMRVYTNDDLLGVELAGATKNVIALAAGVVDGLQAGFNAKSALLARGLAEITRLGVALGASRETFFGVAGVGDLATTCFSPEGRNRSCGEALGRGESLRDYLARTKHVVEGVETTRGVVALAERAGVDMPIARAVHAVLFEGLDPIDAIAGLMRREPKAERVG